MKILQVHKYLYRKAGAEAYVLDLARALEEHRHEVRLWGTDHNAPPPPLTLRGGEPLLVRHLNFDQREGLMSDLKKFGHMIWSFEAARKFERVLQEFKPDVVHIHNIYHHISPSILKVAARYRVPVVMTVHDYHLINPNYVLYDHGAICERTGFSAIAHRCIKNSFTASAADVIEHAVHRCLRVYERSVVRFLTPTEFVKEKLVEGGIEENKIEVVKLPVVHNPPLPSLILREGDRSAIPHLKVRGGRGSYALFAGRLVEEKGIYLVLEMAKRLPEINFKIAGDGPAMSDLALHVTRYTLHNVELLGFVEKEKLQELIVGARLVLVPSLWYDPSPFAVLEAMAAGKVVVGSRIGGIAELIVDGKTGFLVGIRNCESSTKTTKVHNSPLPPLILRGEIVDWVDVIEKLWDDTALLAQVGKAAQEYAARVHSQETHYEKIMDIYRGTRG